MNAMNVVDAHFHLWTLARGDYGWLTPAAGAIYRDVGIDDWLRLAAPLGVGGGVLVQAAASAAETEFLLTIAAAQRSVLGVVGWEDLAAPQAAARIAASARHPLLKGLRPMLQDLPDADWILQPALAPALQAMAEHGLVFDALIRPLHLPRIAELARRFPALRIVIDHAAKPAIGAKAWQPWADDLRRVAATTGAFCKLSGLLTEAGPGGDERQALEPWVQHVLESFGPRRVLWGSDWPVLEQRGSYAGWWRLAGALTAGHSEAERAAIFGGNAIRVYGLEPAPG